MLTHGFAREVPPSRVVIIGASGFVSGAIEEALKSRRVQTLSLKRKDLDLTDPTSAIKLSEILKKDDALLFAAAKAPVKNELMLIENLVMAKTVCDAIRKVSPSHLIYISSDAVYADSDKKLNEESSKSPDSLHGIMHFAREVMLKNAYIGPLCILRPTLIFGKNDPHNGYGPNRFIRFSNLGENIVLFGEGEERRDHVLVTDLGEIGARVIMRQSSGTLNVVSGVINSFKEIAEEVKKLSKNPIRIFPSTRVGAMPHDGYREFDANCLKEAFPDFHCTPLLTWLDENAENLFIKK
jgi:UDP-glucose 4-epimerase